MKFFGGCDVGSTYTKAVILDETGKMVNAPSDLEDGITEMDGTKFWIVDGEKTYGGLMLIDGD